MCSIFGIIGAGRGVEGLRKQALKCSRLQRHRGPDWSGVFADDNAILAHERLSIVDLEHGAQPLLSDDEDQVLAVNGEIYNHLELAKGLQNEYAFRTRSDCEVLIPLLREKGVAGLEQINGMFAFLMYQRSTGQWIVARDPLGIIPLYYGYDVSGRLYFASEMKALIPVCARVAEFPPGHVWASEQPAPQRYDHRPWRDHDTVVASPRSDDQIADALDAAVARHMMCDVPYGVLLSGGLDSSLVAALAQRHAKKRVEDNEQSPAWWPQLHSFAIGLEGSPDLEAAKTTAEALGTIHHTMVFTVQEGLDALRDVIHHIESFDVTTIRASTPMYLLARRIKATGIKMVLSGEGSDEIFGGYLYFHKAPDARSLHEETVRKLAALHQYDCLRANKSMAAWGVEARVPFLDRHFLDTAMSIDPASKLCTDGRMEKHVLRKAFDGVLPEDILWRQKEQFSDGVGYSWIDALRDHAAKEVTDEQMRSAPFRFPVGTPQTKEAFLYRSIFEELFPVAGAADCVPSGPSVACSSAAALEWDPSLKKNLDPSGRAVSVHTSAV